MRAEPTGGVRLPREDQSNCRGCYGGAAVKEGQAIARRTGKSARSHTCVFTHVPPGIRRLSICDAMTLITRP
jgi:hypothetical protein